MAPSADLPKIYDPREVEARWQGVWRDEDNYFDPSSKKPQFIIDTPPPYPTGDFHIGNAFNWCYIDFIARYKRMCGKNVMFPQGWDCHGLPTEVKVEELNHITKNDVSRQEFRRLCQELTEQNIGKMRKTLRKMGFSTDWSNEYVTMRPEYYQKTQFSFLSMVRDGYIYQSEHPVNFCPRCETAIAFAEVSYGERETTLNYFDFDGLEIATTRPELLAACVAVAVHPDDDRYQSLDRRECTVPLFHHRVPIVRDEAVDPSFGSGAVMICTFGDKQDVHWWKQHNLALRKAIDRTGRMTALAGRYKGMKAEECRQAIISDMEEAGILKARHPLGQRVGACWRCKTPIEILSEKQWFVKVRPQEILSAAREVDWYPEHMLLRMENWASQMEWDWCISRQRIFATPIPVWFCAQCGETLFPEPEDLPVDPTVDRPKKPCPACGSNEVVGETDVLDTWMDSSISVMHVTGWDGTRTPPLFPAQIRPQGHDIIRTWAFYTILRSVALTGIKPWDQILVNGMVLGEDGFKMSKSRGNIIVPEEILIKYGADSLRQWAAAGAATGSDITFSWNDVVSASRFQTKMWNIVRFSLMQLQRAPYPGTGVPATLADRWLISRLSETVTEVTAAMEACQFDRALKAIREFAWDTLADNYIELVKGRLYGEGTGRDSACITLEKTIDVLCRLIAPFVPHFSEECYSHLGLGSVHQASWPASVPHEEEAGTLGDLLVSAASAVRRYKNEQGLALNAPLAHVTVYAPVALEDDGDLSRAVNSPVLWRTGEPRLEKVVVGVQFNHSVIGPALRGSAKGFMEVVKALSPESLENPPPVVRVGDADVPVPAGAFVPKVAYTEGGSQVDVLTLEDLIIAIRKES